MINPVKDHRHEYPIIKFWYTKHAGKTIEQLIDLDLPFFEWVVSTFQDVTPDQASYYFRRTGRGIPAECIQRKPPYDPLPEDPEGLYEELCEVRDLDAILFKYRQNSQLNLF